MIIKEENGARILESYIIQKDGFLDANKLFEDLKAVAEIDKENGIELDRHHPAQRQLNRFSGSYMSPTFIKGFKECPARQLYSSFQPFVPSDVTSVGQSVHLILQRFYELDGPLRTNDVIQEITNKVIEEKDQKELEAQIKMYINNYMAMPDYLTGSPMDHKNLMCFNELFLKGTPSPLGIKLPLPNYCLMDRLDYRGDGLYIIDYKSGTRFDPIIATMDGYVPQLITYAWAVEEAYGEKVKGAYLCCPGVPKWVKMPINSLMNQSIYIDTIFDFAEDFKKSAETRIYPEKQMRWCKWCKAAPFCETFNGGNKESIIKMEYDITLKKDNNDEEKEIIEID